MKIDARIRGFICTTAHPSGCKQNVINQFKIADKAFKTNNTAELADKAFKPQDKQKKLALVLGGSTGYGLSARVAAAASGYDTFCVMYERAAENGRTASAGYYNTAAFTEIALSRGLHAKTVNGDAFSDSVKREVVDGLKKLNQKVDLIIYSVAAPRRVMADGTVYNSVLKPIGSEYTVRTLDLRTFNLTDVTIAPASAAEIESTVKVMGGEDWYSWIKLLKKEELLKEDATTVAMSYYGSDLTKPIYYDGTIGEAKKHLQTTKDSIIKKLDVNAKICVAKAVVSQASAAIPALPLYISLLYKIMTKRGEHEEIIDQMCRMFNNLSVVGDIRLDNFELSPDVQTELKAAWDSVTNGNLNDLADVNYFKKSFEQLFGFSVSGIDYERDEDETFGSQLI